MPTWAPAALHAAFEGIAARQGVDGPETMPVFHWGRAAGVLLVDGMEPREIGPILQDSRAIWLVTVRRPAYWALVRAGKLQIWDELHEALEGVGLYNGGRVAVYSKPRTIRHFQDGYVDASSIMTDSELRARALDQFHDLLKYHNGLGTPFFI